MRKEHYHLFLLFFTFSIFKIFCLFAVLSITFPISFLLTWNSFFGVLRWMNILIWHFLISTALVNFFWAWIWAFALVVLAVHCLFWRFVLHDCSQFVGIFWWFQVFWHYFSALMKWQVFYSRVLVFWFNWKYWYSTGWHQKKYSFSLNYWKNLFRL